MKRLTKILSLTLALLLLTGCGTSKEPTNPTFTPGTIETTPPEAPAPEAATLSFQETFSNDGGTAQITFNLQQSLSLDPLPVVEVRPKAITGEDAKAVLEAILPGARCYDTFPEPGAPSAVYTRQNLSEYLARWKSYTQEEIAAAFDGNLPIPLDMDENDPNAFQQVWDKSIQYYEDLLASLPEGDQRKLSDFTMHKEQAYLEGPEEAARMDLSGDPDCHMAHVESDMGNYGYWACSAAADDPVSLFTLSYSVENGPLGVDWQKHLKELEALPAPTQAQMDSAKEAAQKYLDRLPLGDWVLEEPKKEPNGSEIYVGAHLADTSLLGEAAMDLSSGTAPMMGFRFKPDGTLLGFWARGLIEAVQTHAENPKELAPETLLTAAMETLRQEQKPVYGIDPESLSYVEDWCGEALSCDVNVTEACRAYVRMDTPEGTMCYVPSLILYGEATFHGRSSGTAYTSQEYGFLPEGRIPILAVNALDGTPIPLYA